MNRLSHQNCKNDYTSFELFGFDIILDEDFKPWILEVNITPSLKSESDLDTQVKYGVIKDMFNTVGYNLPPQKTEELFKLGKLQEHNIFFDRRLYIESLTKRDKTKHTKFQKLFKVANEHRKTNRTPKVDKDLIEKSGPEFERSGCQTSQMPKSVELELNLNRSNKIESHDPNESSSSFNKNRISDDELNFLKSASDGILQDLTQNDIRVLMLAEDELSRCGRFKRVFPSANSSKYLIFFDKPRYYNLLLDAWEQRYKNNRLEGVKQLSMLANFLDGPIMKND